jgi:excisionase family DNA binding protein
MTNLASSVSVINERRQRGRMDTPLALTINEACEAARAGRTRIYEAISDGKLRARKNGRRTVILADDLRMWMENLPAIQPKAAIRNQGK